MSSKSWHALLNISLCESNTAVQPELLRCNPNKGSECHSSEGEHVFVLESDMKKKDFFKKKKANTSQASAFKTSIWNSNKVRQQVDASLNNNARKGLDRKARPPRLHPAVLATSPWMIHIQYHGELIPPHLKTIIYGMVMANQYQKEHHPCVIKQGVLLCGSTLCCCCRLKLTDTLTRLICVQDQDAFKLITSSRRRHNVVVRVSSSGVGAFSYLNATFTQQSPRLAMVASQGSATGCEVFRRCVAVQYVCV